MSPVKKHTHIHPSLRDGVAIVLPLVPALSCNLSPGGGAPLRSDSQAGGDLIESEYAFLKTQLFLKMYFIF